MSDQTDQPPVPPLRRGRPPLNREMPQAGTAATANTTITRAETVKVARRRRRGMGLEMNLRFALPERLRGDKEYRYHWLCDRPGRIEQKTQYDDWEFVMDAEVEGDERNTGAGQRIERHAGVDQFGQPLRAFLVRKRKEFDDEDKAEGQKALDARMTAIRRGKTPDATTGEMIHADGSYVPPGGIVIKENNT